MALEEGYEVDVVALRRPHELRHEVVDGANVFRLPLSHRRGANFAAVVGEYVAFALAAAAWVARLHVRRRYRVVHIHNPPDFLIASALIPKVFGARVIFDVHDLATDMFSSRFEPGPFGTIALTALRANERIAARTADAVLTVHEPYRRELIQRGVRAESLTVVMNSLDERLLPTTREATDARRRVVYHGTMTEAYGLKLVIQAAKRLARDHNVVFELYGEGDAVTDLRALAERGGLVDRVRIGGSYLPHREVLARVSGASVGVIPNLPTKLNRFALSSKLFEYVALHVPVVSADLPTIQAHFSREELRFFRAGDATSLATAIDDVLSNPHEAAARAVRAFARYQDYRWPVQRERYAQVLRSLSDPPPNSQPPPRGPI